MPGMAFIWCVADIDRFVGNAVAGWAYNEAIPLIFNDEGHCREISRRV
jgi:hypothetical protein